MTPQSPENVLLAKATYGTRLRDAQIVTAARGLRHGLARAAEDLWALSVVCSGIDQEIAAQSDVLDRLDGDALILVLSAPDGAYGLAVLDRAILAALIEVQTLGAVYDTPIDPRPYTTTDAAMAWLYLDRALQFFGDTIEDRDMAEQLAGYRLEEPVSEPRTAGLWLAPGDFQMFSANLDVARGKRSGQLRLVLPKRAVRAKPTERRPTGQDVTNKGFERLPLMLHVRLVGLSVPLGKVVHLQAGDVLALPPELLEKAEVHTDTGHFVAEGKLGQLNGQRAVKLTGPDLPAATGGAVSSPPPELDADLSGQGRAPGVSGAAPSALLDQGGDMAMVASPELPASFPGDASSEPPQKGAQDDLDLPDLEALGGDAPGADAFAAALADEDDDMALDENGLADLDAIAALMEE